MNHDSNHTSEERKGGSAVLSLKPPRPRARPVEEELETGEPIPEEEEAPPTGKKIPALRGKFDGRPSTEPETGASSGGQMVLSSAKYLTPDKYNTESLARKKKRPQSQPEEGGQSLEGKVFNSGFWGGLLAMTVAVIWFFAGLVNDVIFFYPPILFLIGLGAIFKGGSRGE